MLNYYRARGEVSVVTNIEGEKTYHSQQKVIVNRRGNSFIPQWEFGTIVNDSPEETSIQKLADWALVKKQLLVDVDGKEITINQTATSIRPRVDSS
jgi:hypothetical protein